LTLSVWLGCYEHEKRRKRSVSIDIEIYFKEPPLGVRTDRLEDTVCYAELARYLREAVEDKSFDLIEKLSKYLHECSCDFLVKAGIKVAVVKVTSHKILPKAVGIRGGAFFTYIGEAS
jgi:7,8-dihydroneopterin aldolase/epimerase/oxygenase